MQAQPTVLIQNKTERGFLFLFFGVIGLLAAARAITAAKGTGSVVLGVIFGLVGVACVVAWFVQRGRPPGQIVVSSTEIVKWGHGGRYERITPGPLHLSQARVGGQPGGWFLDCPGRPVQVGTYGSGEVRSVEVGMGLLGYHPFELQEVCAAHGWEFVGRQG